MSVTSSQGPFNYVEQHTESLKQQFPIEISEPEKTIDQNKENELVSVLIKTVSEINNDPIEQKQIQMMRDKKLFEHLSIYESAFSQDAPVGRGEMEEIAASIVDSNGAETTHMIMKELSQLLGSIFK